MQLPILNLPRPVPLERIRTPQENIPQTRRERERCDEIVGVGGGQISGERRAPWVHDVAKVRILPPIMYPSKMLNAAANYYAHAGEARG